MRWTQELRGRAGPFLMAAAFWLVLFAPACFTADGVLWMELAKHVGIASALGLGAAAVTRLN